MRWNQALAAAARKLDDAELRTLIADPDVTPNGRGILEAELATRTSRLRQPA